MRHMQDLIARFVQLPLQVRTSVSSPSAIAKLEQIEQRFNVSLADLVIRVMVKDVPLTALATTCQNTFHLKPDQAQELATDLMVQIFTNVANYLGFNPSALAGGMVQESPAHEASLGVEHHDPEIITQTGNLKYEPSSDWYNAEGLVRTLVSQLGRPMDDRLQKRLLKIAESRLVDARSAQETEEALLRPQKIGGMEMDPQMAKQFVTLIEKEYQNIHLQHLKVRRHDEAPKFFGASIRRPVDQGLHHPTQPQRFVPTPPKPNVPKTEQPIKPIIPTPRPISQPVPSAPPKSAASSAIPPIAIPKIEIPLRPFGAPAVKPVTPPAVPPPAAAPIPEPTSSLQSTQEVPHFMPRVYRNVSAQRSVVNDIKIPSKLVGPVEELQQMALEDFRKLGDSVSTCSGRIKEKISMLEHESFEKRSLGLKAWRSSPLMKEYLRIGQESMEKNMDISQLLTQRGTQGLTPEEFDALARLNASLRY